MKILFVSGFNPSHIGGGETWLQEVASSLQSKHSVTVLTSSVGKIANPKLKVTVFHEYRPIKLLRTLRFTKENRTGFTLPSFDYYSMFRNDFEDSDVVYAIYFSDLQFICLYFQFVTGTPVVLGHHTAIDRLKFDPSLAARLAYKFLVPTNVRMESSFAAHHVLNDRDLKTILRLGGKNIFKIPNGVHTARFSREGKFDTFTLLFVGRLVNQKGVDFLPQIVEKLNGRISDYRLYIIGDGELSKIVNNIQSKKVVWLGFVPEDLKNHYLMSSHVLIAPSRHETFLITGLEALAAGTPVITFDIPGPREFVINDYNGFLVHSLDEMCDKIVAIYLTHKDGSYWDMVKNARTTAERFDWRFVIPQIETSLQKVQRLKMQSR